MLHKVVRGGQRDACATAKVVFVCRKGVCATHKQVCVGREDGYGWKQVRFVAREIAGGAGEDVGLSHGVVLSRGGGEMSRSERSVVQFRVVVASPPLTNLYFAREQNNEDFAVCVVADGRLDRRSLCGRQRQWAECERAGDSECRPLLLTAIPDFLMGQRHRRLRLSHHGHRNRRTLAIYW